MKKLTIAVLTLVFFTSVSAQQKPHYTQYILNQFIINPAITGIENYTDIKLSHRHQWVGIQDAPVTTYFTLHTALGKRNFAGTATSNELDNPRGRTYWENYQSAEPHHGIGMQIVNDRTGPLNRFAAYATYAYHIGLTPTTSLSAGFGAGITNISLNADKLYFNVPIDPAVYTSGVINQVKPDLMAGIYLYSATYFAGLSVQQIIPQKINYANGQVVANSTDEGKQVPHIFASAGYRVLVGDDFNLIPSVMIKYVSPTPLQADLNAKLQYRDRAWIGATMRTGEGFAGMAGLNVSNSLSIGYSYDYTTSKLNTFSKGTHEIVVGFIIGNKYDDSCPKNVW